ncbi:histone deacetylase [candidate division WOR-3 bacterium]|nr:histone deacetylase [candidate division WOR-3 bacterium]
MSVGYLYDPAFLEHDAGPGHPESPARLCAILDRLETSGLLGQLQQVPVIPADDGAILRVHDLALLERLQQLAEAGGGRLDPDTHVGPGSYAAARMAAGAAVCGARAVWHGDVQRAFALTRPPGHHAERGRGMGFCLLNNVAIAGHWLLAQGVGRIAIVDLDAHHGNGTAAAFAEDPRVAYVSVHQYPWYPSTGDWREMGRGAGKGTELNIPLPAESGDHNLLLVMDEIIGPSVRRFAPEMILVSMGYDGHWADPLTWLLYSLRGLELAVQELVGLADALCGGRMLFTLEGGYDLDALGYGVVGTMAALLGQDYPDPLGPADEPEPAIEELVAALTSQHPLLEMGA